MTESDLNATGAEKELGRLQSSLRVALPLAGALREFTRETREGTEVARLIEQAHGEVERADRNVRTAREILRKHGHRAWHGHEHDRGREPEHARPALIDVAPEPGREPAREADAPSVEAEG